MKKYLLLVLFVLTVGHPAGSYAATNAGKNKRITLTKIEDASADIGIHNLRMKVAVTGDIAQVELTMLVANRSKQTRAGYLRMPLPNDAVVTRFAIDIKGGMLDAIALNNERAELVWFKEASKFLTPGGGFSRTVVAEAGGVRTDTRRQINEYIKTTLERQRDEIERKRGEEEKKRLEEKSKNRTIDEISKETQAADREHARRAEEYKIQLMLEKLESPDTSDVEEETLQDPGLLAWEGDNRLKMQIFPITPERSRCVTITYTTQLIRDGGYARLNIPLCFAGWVRSYDLTVELDREDATPQVTLKGLPTPKFEKNRNRLVGTLAAEYVSLPDSFALSFAKDKWDEQLVQKAADGNMYFALRPSAIEEKVPVVGKQISRAAILWDASASEWGKSQEPFFKTLTAWLEQPGMKNRQLTIDAVPFHIREEEAAHFDLSYKETGPLFAYLKSRLNDGATSLKLKLKQKQPELYLLFTDGRATCSKSIPKKFPAPVFVFSRGDGANTTLLKQISQKSGGCYFDLTRIKPAEAVRYMCGEIETYKETRICDGKVSDLIAYPWRHSEAGALVFGRLTTPTAKIELLYGNDETQRIPFALSEENAVKGEQLRAMWAGRRALADRKHADSIGKKYHIITPKTSMLVMEDIGQYRRNALPFPKRLLTLSRPHQLKRSSGPGEDQRIRPTDRKKFDEVILPKKIRKSELMKAYAEQKQAGHLSATFYLSWAKILIRHGKNNDALRVLSNLRELDLIDNNSYDDICAFQGWALKYKSGRFWRKEEKLLKLLLQPPWYSASAGK